MASWRASYRHGSCGRVIREDNGNGNLAQEFGELYYTVLLTGTDPSIPQEFLLPEEFRVDVIQATDQQIFQAISQLIAAYTDQLLFSQDNEGNFNLSPYDLFLEVNDLPRQPGKWESALSYSQRLLANIQHLESRGHLKFLNQHFKARKKTPLKKSIQFVERNPQTEDGKFQFHDQPFTFGPEELKGLKIFFLNRFSLSIATEATMLAPVVWSREELGIALRVILHQTSPTSDFTTLELLSWSMIGSMDQEPLPASTFQDCKNEIATRTHSSRLPHNIPMRKKSSGLSSWRKTCK